MGKTTQDLSELENYFSSLTELATKQVEYGFYDEQHYSGLNMATLAAIHEQGWHNLPERNFIYSTAALYNENLSKHLKNMHKAIVAKRPYSPYLQKIGRDGAASIKYTIQQGTFSNPKVSRKWAAVKGFDDAMIHYGDLSEAATFKVVKYNRSEEG